ncbi:MAG: nitroreductase family protein [Kiritimatiellia bacterium]|jgi:nitroreductase
MMNFKVDADRCTGCGACVEDCPTKAIIMADGIPAVAEGGERRCLGCQHCLAVCPVAAVEVCGVRPEDCLSTKDEFPTHESMAALIKFRRACRSYHRANVAPWKLDAVLDALQFSPTGCNSRAMHFSVVDNLDAMDVIRAAFCEKLLGAINAGTLPPMMKIMQACRPMLERGEDPLLFNAPHMIIAAPHDKAPCSPLDPIIALTTFELMAQSLGLGTLWCGFAQMIIDNLCPEAKELLGIPKDHHLGAVMLFGEPSVEYYRATRPRPFGLTRVSSLSR